MILGIEKEITIFLQSILAGNFLCLMYKAVSVFRVLVKHGSIWISLEDFAFWSVAAVYIFLNIQNNCSGSIRWYYILGLLGGSLMTHYFVRKIARKYIAKTKKTE